MKIYRRLMTDETRLPSIILRDNALVAVDPDIDRWVAWLFNFEEEK